MEGPHLLKAAVAAGLRVDQLLVSPHFLDHNPELPHHMGMAPVLVEARLLDEFADSDSPRGLLALVEAPAQTMGSPASGKPLLFIDRVQDPGNLGALVRVAEASGTAQVLLSPGCASMFHPRALRASAGSALRQPYRLGVAATDLRGIVGERRSIAAMVPLNGSDPYDGSLPCDSVLCVGSEGAGLDQRLIDQADCRATIPLRAPVESLNVSVAAALVLFELARRERSPGPQRSP